MTILGGTWLLRLIKMHAFVEIHGNKDGGKMDAWGVAGGINAPVINNGRDCNIEYQFRDEINQSLMATHSLNVRFDVGRHREETYARKMSLLVNLLPGDLYNKALKLYHEGKFWDSYFVFGQLLVLFPDFFKNDMAMYYRGSCLEEMDMREHAISTYEQVKAKYPKSSTLPLVDLGIMRVAYRNNDALMVQGQYRLLSGDNVPDSITSHADYLVGQTMVGVGDSKQAIRMLTRIPESHPEYVFAMHSAGVAHILAMEFSEAMECFEKCLEAQIKTPAQKEIYHRSCLFLGYLFYREESLSKAVTALRMVPPESYYYEDALLGLGWCAAKSGKWGDCMTSGTLLAKASSKPVLKYEAALIKAYGLIMTKDYMAAKNELEPVIEPLKAMQLPTQDTLRAAKSRNALVKSTYGRIASEAEELSLVQESSETIKKTDSLHVHQQNLLGELDRFRKYENEFARLQIFGRDISRLRDDVEYALAVAEKHSAESGTEKVRDKLKEKTEDINQEIQKIQNEMEKIEGTE
jgi:tetratricopeptide (TPR) repeat protein